MAYSGWEAGMPKVMFTGSRSVLHCFLTAEEDWRLTSSNILGDEITFVGILQGSTARDTSYTNGLEMTIMKHCREVPESYVLEHYKVRAVPQ